MRAFLATLLLATTLAGCNNNAVESLPGGDPRAAVAPGPFGARIRPEAMAGNSNSVVWRAAVLAGGENIDAGGKPSAISQLKNNSTCDFPRPDHGDKIALIHTTAIAQESPYYYFERMALRERAEKFVAAWKKDGKEPALPVAVEEDNLRLANVVVTDTSAPVYLVLYSMQNTIWNVRLGPGARLSKIAIIGKSFAALANVPADVDASFLSSAIAQGCNGTVWRRPNASWGISGDAKTDKWQAAALGARNTLYINFNTWFRATFGTDSEAVIYGGDEGSNFLVGPAPLSMATRIPYAPVSGAELRMNRAENFFAGKRIEYKARHDDLLREQARALTGGDLASFSNR